MYYLKYKSLKTDDTGLWETVQLGQSLDFATAEYERYSRVYKFVSLYRSETTVTEVIVQESTQ